MRCLFVSDLHGRAHRYEALLAAVRAERPQAVFLGGDLVPRGASRDMAGRSGDRGFVDGYLADGMRRLALDLGADYPQVLAILGNDDPRSLEAEVERVAAAGLWTYAHGRRSMVHGVPVFGYSFVPPSPFLLKDWERYDVSRFVDPGSVSPEEGYRTVPVRAEEVRFGTMARDLEDLTAGQDLSDAVMLFHAPPHETFLDRADLDGRCVDHAPLDVHVGSIAIRRFVERRQPRITLHGHVHESARLTGHWRDRIGATHMFSAAHDGPELALVRFDTDCPEEASRALL